MTLNAFPPKTRHFKPMPQSKVAAFEEAIGMLEDQLESEENDLKQIPILLIDSITQVGDDDLFNSLGSSLKNLVDSDLIKVVILAANGASRQKVLSHKDLASRLCGQDEITNDFTVQDIGQILEHKETFADIFKKDKIGFSLIAEAMHRVSGGRVGYVKKLCKETGSLSAVAPIIKAVQERGDKRKEEILADLEEIMVEFLFDNFYINVIVEAFEELANNGFDVDSLICADLPNKQIGGKAVKILVHHNIIDTLHSARFESEPLRRIFASEKLRQKIQKRVSWM